jgi:hypothetical protein
LTSSITVQRLCGPASVLFGCFCSSGLTGHIIAGAALQLRVTKLVGT